MQTKALGPRWPRAHDVVDMLATAGAVVTEQARPVRDLDLIDAGSRACQVERLHDVGGLHRRPRMCCNSQKAARARLVESSVDAGLAMTFHRSSHLPMRYDTDRPRSVIRLRISQPRTTSLPCPAGLRARRPAPMMDLYRKNAFSARPWRALTPLDGPASAGLAAGVAWRNACSAEFSHTTRSSASPGTKLTRPAAASDSRPRARRRWWGGFSRSHHPLPRPWTDGGHAATPTARWSSTATASQSAAGARRGIPVRRLYWPPHPTLRRV